MFYRLLIIGSLLFCPLAFAQDSSEGIKTWLEEEDGSPSVIVYKAKVSNDSLTDNGDGTASLTTGGGASGWTDGGANVYTTTSTDKVGIGTTAPTQLLQVGTSPTPGLVVEAGGSVGIGLTNASDPLHIRLPAVGSNSYFKLDSAAGNTFSTRFGTTANNLYAWFTNVYYTGSAFAKDDADKGAWRFFQAAATTDAASSLTFDYFPVGSVTPIQVMKIKGTSTGGNVGIGTTNPAQALDVAGTVNATTFTGANVTSGADPGHTHTGASLSTIDISADTNATGGAGVDITDDDFTFDATELSAQTWSAGGSAQFSHTYDLSGTDPKINFNNNSINIETGNMGIGNTAPQALLDVGTTPGLGLIVTNAFSVGIGTTNPEQLLHMVGGKMRLDSAALAPSIILNNTTPGAATALIAGTQKSSFLFDSAQSFSIQPRTNAQVIAGSASAGASVFEILGSGFIGIGTTSVAQLLQVGTNPTPGLIVEKGGFVGLGTTNATARLNLVPSSTAPAEGLYINFAGAGITLKSPDGTCAQCTLANDESFGCVSVTCP